VPEAAGRSAQGHDADPGGRALTDESLDEASFRRAIIQTRRQLASGAGPGWFSSAWPAQRSLLVGDSPEFLAAPDRRR